MQLCITIEDSGAAFDDAPASELARILRKLADKLEHDGIPDKGDEWTLRDLNGNRCGAAVLA